jgi:hypothetical protein
MDNTVLFRPFAERVKTWGGGPLTNKRFLTDHGDHVEWTDGKRVTRMRLPDQPDASDGYPVLQSFLIAPFNTPSYAPGRVGFARVRFLDPDGRVIAWFNGQNANTTMNFVRTALPPEVFTAMQTRGVEVTEQVYTSEKSFFDDHPDPRVTGKVLSFARHPWLWIGSAVAIFTVVYFAILIATGKY